MKKNWRLIFIFIIYLSPIWITLLTSIYEYESEESTGYNDYARITDVDYKAELVDEPTGGGKVIITEKLTYDVHAADKDNLYWELWRDLPEKEVDGLKVDYKVNYVKEIDKNGNGLYYEESPKLYWDDSDYTDYPYGPNKWYHSPGPYSEYYRRYECVLFYVDGIYRDKVTYEVQYEMNNAALRYSDVSELYLTMYSESSIKYLNSFKGQILIPNKDMPKQGNYSAYTFGTNKDKFDFTESDTLNPGYHTFSFDLDKNDLKFRYYNQYIEFILLGYNEDKHSFTDYAPNNIYSNDVYLEEAFEEINDYYQIATKAKENKTKIFTVSMIITCIIILFTITKNKRIKNKYTFYTPITKLDFFREIPSDLDPHFAASLAFVKSRKKVDDSDSYSALMLSLVRKGYIELEKIDETKNWTFKNILIKILYKPSSNNSNIESVLEKNKTINNNPITNTPLFPTFAGKTLEENYETKTNSITTRINNEFPTQTTITEYANSFEVREQKNTITNEPTIIKEPTINDLINNKENLNIIDQNEDLYNIKGKKLEKLSKNEKSYFNLIIRHSINDHISMEIFQLKVQTDYNNTDTFVTSVNNSIINIGVTDGYLQKVNYEHPKNNILFISNFYLYIGLILLIIVNPIISLTRLDLAFGAFLILGTVLIICSIYLKKIAKKYILLTQFGEDEYEKWKGLYNFLNSKTLMNEKTLIELPLWEKYLVYATAFGISEKVIKALEIRCPDFTPSPMLSNKYYRSSSFRTTSRSFGRSTRIASSASRSYSSSGGFYGGGRGGGGGGGGH